MTTHAAAYAITLDQPQDWLNANERAHWSRRSTLTRYWRDLACAKAKQARIPRLDRARVIVTAYKPTKRRFDAGNLHPTAKACVDGIVDAQILDDDDHLHLDGPDMRAGVGPRRLVIQIISLPPLTKESA